MISERLSPQMRLLREDYVLIQAWKKASAHIRAHSWYADVLELDRTAVDLPRFINECREALESPDKWNPSLLRLVPAPKSQQWHIDDKGKWKPRDGIGAAERSIRPLAHVSIRDQVVSTALLLCLADRVESAQADPRLPISEPQNRRAVVSYGHRLFGDRHGKSIRHRWGSSKLYRSYFQDYRRFLGRPEMVAETLKASHNRVAIVHADLSKFYDRVQPKFLHRKLATLEQPGDDRSFFDFARRVFDWKWHSADRVESGRYAHAAGIDDFTTIALPQGLVAAGFFANIVLLDFDQALRERLEKPLASGIILRDACRYVDDLRLVVEVSEGKTVTEVKNACFRELTRMLGKTAKGLLLNDDPKKMAVAFHKEENRPLVPQSRGMERIQHAVSGGFDAKGGAEILAAINGLFRTQEQFGRQRQQSEIDWKFSPLPDVRDETVTRFGAGRYRRTFRSLRVLLEDTSDKSGNIETEVRADDPLFTNSLVVSRTELDDQAEIFAIGLIESWITDPSNVRLLRIALDLFPDPAVLDSVLGWLGQYTDIGGGRKAPRRVAWYCLAEVFRAGATETGIVDDDEFLPSGSDIVLYRERLTTEAKRLINGHFKTLPWYLKQQILLFLASVAPEEVPLARLGREIEIVKYRQLIAYLAGKDDGVVRGDDVVINAILGRRSYLNADEAIVLATAHFPALSLEAVTTRDPIFAEELIQKNPSYRDHVNHWVLRDLSLLSHGETGGWMSLDASARQPDCLLRDESNLLRFAVGILRARLKRPEGTLIPSEVEIQIEGIPETSAKRQRTVLRDVRLLETGGIKSVLYQLPAWCSSANRWRFELGMLMRYALTGRPDFLGPVVQASWKEGRRCYRAPQSHWAQRLYGNFNGRDAFGAPWLPISAWIEDFLLALLRWPGCRASKLMISVAHGPQSAIKICENRIALLEELRGKSTGTLHLLHLSKPGCKKPRGEWKRSLRVCVAQTVVPEIADWTAAHSRADLELSHASIRRRHRSHLAAMLAGIEQMLRVRATHFEKGNQLDWIIFPELSVHPDDVRSLLFPFVRRHRCMILAGLTYHDQRPNGSLINSALWILPEWSAESGLRIHQLEQGKEHLSHDEERMGSGTIIGFRPAQWLIGYQWNWRALARPLILSASVCYDATDLHLAADLRDCSDIYAICALNKDITTFDTMSQALHYHMYQMVVLSNNGAFGGSNAYSPYNLPYHRQVFHAHGQPQATVAFIDIDPAELLGRGRNGGNTNSSTQRGWKTPPAGWTQRP